MFRILSLSLVSLMTASMSVVVFAGSKAPSEKNVKVQVKSASPVRDSNSKKSKEDLEAEAIEKATAKPSKKSGDVDLFDLLEDGNINALKKIPTETLKTTVNEHGESLLIRAITLERVSIWKFLLSKGAVSIDHRDKEGNTALMYAVSAGDSAAVRALLAKSADLTLTYGENKESILFEAVRIGDREVFELLLRSNKDLANQASGKKETPLIEAVRSAQASLALALVKEHGASLPTDLAQLSQLETDLKSNKSAQAKELLLRLKK